MSECIRKNIFGYLEGIVHDKNTRNNKRNEPDKELVYKDEIWLNAGHRIKKEWVDLEALQNSRRSIADYGTVGCTKD